MGWGLLKSLAGAGVVALLGVLVHFLASHRTIPGPPGQSRPFFPRPCGIALHKGNRLQVFAAELLHACSEPEAAICSGQ